MIGKCGKCDSSTAEAAKFQDAKYGKGNRVLNPLKKKEKAGQEHRCTVCGTVK